ncbi:MAG: trigger factor [Actinomycetaceae bacterium]|nr:trigger factor [Actinomycetaceae bacterium]
MKTSVEYLEPAKVELTVEVPFEEFKPEIDKAAKEISKQVAIPGFRRGHVPMRVLEAQFGRGVLVQEAVNNSLDGYYAEALKENNLVPLGQPEVDVTEVPAEKGQETDLVFVVKMPVRPEIAIPNPAGYTLEVESVAVSDDEVEERLTSLRERFGTLKDVERAAAEGDYCTINLRAVIGEEEVDNAEGISYQIGSGNMVDGIDEALTGAKVGDEKTFTTALAGGEHEGEEAEVTVVVSAIKESELPEADDDFAQMASEFDTIDELRADMREQVAKDKTATQVYAARDLLLEKLSEEVEVPLPEEIIEAEVKAHLEQEGKEADDEHGKEIREESEKALKTQLMLDVLAEKFNAEASQDELLNSLIQQAQMYGIDPNEFIQMVVQSGQLESFAADMRRNKAVLSALRLAKVVDGDGNELDVASVIGEAPEGEETPDFS